MIFAGRSAFAVFLLSSAAWAQTGIPDFDNPNFRPASRFVEMTPRITEVEVKQGDPFVEVFISGFVSLDCYDVREYHVEKADVSTRIIPRFRKSKPDVKCNEKLVAFREKAADLDPNSPATHRVDVLGYLGWHSEFFKGAPAAAASLATAASPNTAIPPPPPPTPVQPLLSAVPTVEPPPPPEKKKIAKVKKVVEKPIEVPAEAASEDVDPVEEYPVVDPAPPPPPEAPTAAAADAAAASTPPPAAATPAPTLATPSSISGPNPTPAAPPSPKPEAPKSEVH